MPKPLSRDTRQQILDKAMDLASVEGLEGVSIGQLADGLGVQLEPDSDES